MAVLWLWLRDALRLGGSAAGTSVCSSRAGGHGRLCSTCASCDEAGAGSRSPGPAVWEVELSNGAAA